jgi:hypothetical protein
MIQGESYFTVLLYYTERARHIHTEIYTQTERDIERRKYAKLSII